MDISDDEGADTSRRPQPTTKPTREGSAPFTMVDNPIDFRVPIPKGILVPSGRAIDMPPSPNPEDYSLVRITRVNLYLTFHLD